MHANVHIQDEFITKTFTMSYDKDCINGNGCHGKEIGKRRASVYAHYLYKSHVIAEHTTPQMEDPLFSLSAVPILYKQRM